MTDQVQGRLVNSTAVRRRDRALLGRLVKSFQATAQHGRLHLLADQLAAVGFEDVRVNFFLTPRNGWDVAIQYARGPSERSARDRQVGSHDAASKEAGHGR